MDPVSKQQKMNDSIKLIQGSIAPEAIARCIADYSKQTQRGAHSIFLGQVRNDAIEGREVKAIEYTTYEAMAYEVADKIVQQVITKFELTEVRIFHSLGLVAAGEICLFVIAVSKHRKNAIDACAEVVEEIKKDLPIWGKEIFSDDSHQWKVNG